MIIDTYSKERFRLYANHEAGHLVVSKVLGFKVGDIELTITNINGNHSASAIIELDEPIKNIEDVVDYCERRVQVLYAGAFAESLTNNEIDNDKALNSWKNGGKSDFDKLRESIRIIRNIKFPEHTDSDDIQAGIDEIDSELVNKSAQLVSFPKNWTV